MRKLIKKIENAVDDCLDCRYSAVHFDSKKKNHNVLVCTKDNEFVLIDEFSSVHYSGIDIPYNCPLEDYEGEVFND